MKKQTGNHTLSVCLLFNLIGFVFVFLIQLFQAYLPLNPANLANVSWHSAFNTSVSFMTNTNWQGYAGETTLSYFVQMIGLTVQNFVSAATGIAVLLALIRGFHEKPLISLVISGLTLHAQPYMYFYHFQYCLPLYWSVRELFRISKRMKLFRLCKEHSR